MNHVVFNMEYSNQNTIRKHVYETPKIIHKKTVHSKKIGTQ